MVGLGDTVSLRTRFVSSQHLQASITRHISIPEITSIRNPKAQERLSTRASGSDDVRSERGSGRRPGTDFEVLGLRPSDLGVFRLGYRFDLEGNLSRKLEPEAQPTVTYGLIRRVPVFPEPAFQDWYLRKEQGSLLARPWRWVLSFVLSIFNLKLRDSGAVT